MRFPDRLANSTLVRYGPSATLDAHAIRRYAASLFACLLGFGTQARAAGGHHAVDDATILEPGSCQLETWVGRNTDHRTLIHIGPACRVGAVELGLNLDRALSSATGSALVGGPQLKWARALGQTFSAGVVLSAAWQDTSPRFAGGTLVVPLTWRPSDTLLAHFNLGRDFRNAEADTTRAGAALEWSPLPAWSFVAERFREFGADYWRAGARWTLSPAINIDLSRSRGLSGGASAAWTLGLSWLFDKR